MKIHKHTLLTVIMFGLLGLNEGIQVCGQPGIPMIGIYTSSRYYPGGATIKLVEGDWIRFSVDWVSGTPPFSYQWIKNGAPLLNATERSFRLDPVIVSDTGIYSVTVSDPYGSAQISTNTLTVIARPAIAQTPPGAVLLGATVSLAASTPPAYPQTNGQWYFKGKPVSGATNATLAITQAKFGDDGEYEYRCDYQNFEGPAMTRYGVRSAPYRVRVYAAFTPPIIVTQPKNQTSLAGGSAVFAVGAAGTPPFTYQWRKNGVAVPAGTNFFLALSNVTAGDVANYTVVATGMSGSVTSQVAAFSLSTAPTPNPSADALVTSGRASLALQSNDGLRSARAVFGSAVVLAPTHELANFFEAVTRVADLLNKPATQHLLDRLLVSPTGRDPYQWEASATFDSEGNLEAPAAFSLGEGARFWRDYLLPESQAALTNLSRVMRSGFLAQLTAAETTSSDVTVDQGDLWITRALLHAGEYAGRTLNSWNLEVQLNHLKSLYVTNKEMTVQRLLEEFPQLLTISDATQLAPARAALENAVDAYVQGIGMIRARTEGTRRLFNLERDSLAEEERFRQFLLDLKASLAVSMTVNEQPQFKLNWGAFNSASNSLRAILPRFAGQFPDAATLPSATFGGLVGSDGPPMILFQPLERRFYSGSSLALGVEAVGKGPLRYQWQKNGLNLPDANNATLFLANAYPNDQGDYRVVISNSLGAVTSAVAHAALPQNAVASWGQFYELGLDGIYEHRAFAPQGLKDVVAIASGNNFDAALKADGTVVCWGPDAERGYLPAFLRSISNAVGIALQGFHLMILCSDGQAQELYVNQYSPAPLELANIKAIAAGMNHGLVLINNGTVVGRGSSLAVSALPFGLANVKAIATSEQFALALQSNGTIVAWGNIPAPVPSGLAGVVSIAAGNSHCLALKQDGRVVQWGMNAPMDDNPPSWLSNVVAISAGYNISLAVRSDGSLVAWGDTNQFADFEITGLTGISRMAGITAAAIALPTYIARGGVVMGPLLIKNPPRDTQVSEGGTASLEVYVASAAEPINYQWFFNGIPIQGATAPMLILSNVTSSSAGNYSVRVDNGGAVVTSQTAKLRVQAINDGFTAARQIPGGGGRLLGSTLWATRESGEPTHAGNRGGHSLWFLWQAPANSMVTMDTIGSSFDTLLAVYTGPTISNLTLVAADDDGAIFNNNSRVSFAAIAGVTYFIAVDGYNGDAGALIFNLIPQVTMSGLVRASANQFDFLLTAPGQSNVIIEASSDLRLWVPLNTNLAPENGLIQFRDANASQPARYYRALLK